MMTNVTAAVVFGLLGSAVSDEVNHPFARFFGTWTLENDRFQQVWDEKTVETLSIPNHLTECASLNTPGSVLCVVDAGDFAGHILWTLAPDGETVAHQSHFGTRRLGDGKGSLSENGDLVLRIRFTDEPEGTYRVYEYIWDGPDRYEMRSRQYTAQGERTGNWYGGAFIRIGNASESRK